MDTEITGSEEVTDQDVVATGDEGTSEGSQETPVEETIEQEAAAPEGESEEVTEPEGEETEGGEEEAVELAPEKFKFKAGVYNKDIKDLEQKEFEIDKKFAPLMTTPEGEKLVRELHEKAYGLDGFKERLSETRQNFQRVSQQNRTMETQVGELREIYQSAVKTQNYHKLDSFFEKLDIPQEAILNYALAKVQLNEMDPAQKQAVLEKNQAEERAMSHEKRIAQYESQMEQQAVEMKQVEIRTTLSSPEVTSIAQAFDAQVGKSGAFEEQVRRAGELAWYQSKGKTVLTARQAVQQVVQAYGLGNATASAQQPAAAAQPQGSQKTVVKRTTATLPNMHGRSASAVGTAKPRSIADIEKYRKEQYGF